MIPFYRPYYSHSEIIAALRPGAKREVFESGVAARMGAKYGIAFAHARSGLAAVFNALNIKDSEIVITAYTCILMPLAIVASGNKPVFVDIDPANYNMDISKIHKALTPKTKAIIVTHLYGYPTEIDAIKNIIDNKQIIVIEDSAQRLPSASEKNTPLRSKIGLCSFGLNKELCTVEGGVVVTNSARFYEQIKAYRDKELSQVSTKVWAKRWTRLLANFLVFHKPVYGLLHRLGYVGETFRLTENSNFNPAVLPGANASIYMNFQARIGLAQLDKMDTIIQKRQMLANYYNNELSDIPNIVLPPAAPNANYSYYTLRIPEQISLTFRSQMLTKGIAADDTYEYALPFLKPFRKYATTQYPHALKAAKETVNLPNYPHLGLADAQHIANSSKLVLRNGLRGYKD